MARDDETSALELHIKVNEQNLSAISEKCNIGTLRPPSDPSWPKIPPRRLNDNTDDIIEPPCVVTLIGTPRKGIVRAVTCQHTRPKLNQKYEVPTRIPKKLPGFIDPRFKKQISQQKTEILDKSCNTKNNKQMTEINTHDLQEIKKTENRLQETIGSADNYTCYNSDKLLESITKKEITDCPIKEQLITEPDHCKTALQCVTDERCDIENKFPQIQNQETGRPLILMIDEKKIHALSVNALNVETTASSNVQALQCYSVQIPVVAYHNVPLQISNMPRQMQEDIKIKCQSDNVKDLESVGNIYDPLSTLANSTYGKESENEKCIHEDNVKNSNDISGYKNIFRCETSGWIYDNEENVNSNVSLNQNTINETLLDKSHREKFNVIDNTDNGESSSDMTTAKRLKTFVEQRCNRDNLYIMNRCEIERKTLNETKIAKTSLREQKLEQYHENNNRIDLNESFPINVMNNKMLKDVAFNEECDNKDKEECENKEKYEDLRVNVKRKTASINLSQKAKSFFRKKSRLAITDSDCTLILPGSRHIKGKQYESTRSKISQLLHRRNGINNTKSTIRSKFNNPKLNRQINSCSLTNLQVKGNLFEESSFIPLETQELLNKSYWEYYWKLRRKIALINKPDNAGERDKSRECLPESQTLQQCSALSCMINTVLRDSTAIDGRSSSDPIAFNARHETLSSLAKKTKRRKTKRASKWKLLGLSSVSIQKESKYRILLALLSITIYVAVIFLPIMYDYFFNKKYENDYENTNYIGLALQYVASSFGEAFDRIVDVFLRPRPCGKCNNVI